VHDPGASATSTAPSYPGMHYTIGSPWSRLIEVQGFGGSMVLRPDGSRAGTVTVSANSVSRYTTFVVDKSVLGGTPASGWVLTVALTGQDGTHGDDQTRGFTSTPGDYTFGVCATADTTPRCTADPGSVPKVLDTITPSGTSQSDELDPTQHDPVVLSGVTVP
jgi:glucoamylase